MSSHRYWRVRNIVPVGMGALELTEFQLLNGTSRADLGATLSSSTTPTVGALSSLADDSTSSAVVWARAEGVMLDWDLGTAAEVNNLLMGAAGTVATFPLTLTLQWSDDGITYMDARKGDLYEYPGHYQKTRNVALTPVVRSTGTLNAVNTGPTSLVCNPPPEVEVGDLLVVAVVATAAGATPPAGFERRAAVGPAGTSNYYAEVWTRSVASEMDKDPGTWGNALDVIAMAVSGGLRGPVYDSHNTVATGTANNASQAVPTLVAAGGARLGISAAFWSLAFLPPTGTDMEIQPRPPWVKRFSAMAALRLGLATIPLAAGESMTGTWSTDATNANPIGGWAVIALMLAGTVQIEMRDRPPVRPTAAPGRVLPLQPAPAYADFAKNRTVAIRKLRRNFAEHMRGLGNGRISGTTKDKGAPNVPVSERTMLFRQRDCQPLREVLSTPGTGAYLFDYIDETETYFVVSFDHDGVFRAVIADNLRLGSGLELIA